MPCGSKPVSEDLGTLEEFRGRFEVIFSEFFKLRMELKLSEGKKWQQRLVTRNTIHQKMCLTQPHRDRFLQLRK